MNFDHKTENNALADRSYKVSGLIHNIFRELMFISIGNAWGERENMKTDRAVR